MIVIFITLVAKVNGIRFTKAWTLEGILDDDEIDRLYASGSLFTYKHGLLGANQVIGLVGTGVALNNCYFSSKFGRNWVKNGVDTLGSSVPLTLSPDHASILSYVSVDGRFGEGITQGTIIAGIISGSVGNNSSFSEFDGIAPESQLQIIDIERHDTLNLILPNITDILQITYDVGGRIQAHPWTGITPTRISDTVSFGEYDNVSYQYDKFVYDHSDFLTIVAAGFELCPSNYNTTIQLASPALSRNSLVIGAHINNPVVFDYMRDNLEDISLKMDRMQFSAVVDEFTKSIYSLSSTTVIGTVGNRIIKPDIYAPGMHLIGPNSMSETSTCADHSFRDTGDLWYEENIHGSGIAVGVVSGLAAVAREYYSNGFYPCDSDNPNNLNAFSSPSAALIKATLIHGAVQSPYGSQIVKPHFTPGIYKSCNIHPYNENLTVGASGFGYVRLDTVLEFPTSEFTLVLPGHDEGNSLTGVYGDPFFTNTGQVHEYAYCLHGDGKITLVYTDFVIDTTERLVSNLDMTALLTVRDGYFNTTTLLYGNGIPSDSTNNVEVIYLHTEAHERVNLTIAITAAYLPPEASIQAYAVILTAIGDSITHGFCGTIDTGAINTGNEPANVAPWNLFGAGMVIWVIMAIGTMLILCCIIPCISCISLRNEVRKLKQMIK